MSLYGKDKSFDFMFNYIIVYFHTIINKYIHNYYLRFICYNIDIMLKNAEKFMKIINTDDRYSKVFS